MKRILLGLVTIVGAASVIYVGATGAFFSDTETSTGNTFAAGDIDLKVDNESYYNGNVCAETEPGSGVWQWQGDALFPVHGTPCTTSWLLDDLTGHLFFDFTDIKPDDEGEDTISLHVSTNDAYMCMNIELTENSENGVNEPEAEAGDDVNLNGLWDGELAQNIQMVWWADDGDNVLEVGEQVISNGVQTLFNLAHANGPFVAALADSQNNIWTGVAGPAKGNTTYYVAKAWCFGNLSLNPVPAGEGDNPSVASGVTCDGIGLGNITQTDGAKLDISFNAVQARNNPNFLCTTPEQCAFSAETPGANLIQNGDFESPEVTSGPQWDIFDSPAGGWFVQWRNDIPLSFNSVNRPDPAHLELHEGVLGSAYDGDQYAELDSDWNGHSGSLNNEPASVRIYQDIPTVVGATYRVTYAFAPRPNSGAATNRLEMFWGGDSKHDTGTVVGAAGPINWTPITFTVVATTTTTRVEFLDRGVADSFGTFLDGVKVEQISCALPLIS